MSYSEKLVDAGRDPKSDPSRNPKVVTHTNNGNFKQKLFINQTIPVVVVPINPFVVADVVGVQEILSPG